MASGRWGRSRLGGEGGGPGGGSSEQGLGGGGSGGGVEKEWGLGREEKTLIGGSFAPLVLSPAAVSRDPPKTYPGE
jgi:hypothetical protein